MNVVPPRVGRARNHAGALTSNAKLHSYLVPRVAQRNECVLVRFWASSGGRAAHVCPNSTYWRKHMKRTLVVTLVMAGLFAVGSSAIRHRMAVGSVGVTNPFAKTIADGNPPPPPFPPGPSAYQQTPWLTADGNPPPPPIPPYPIPPTTESV
jgi:hypothetical protein